MMAAEATVCRFLAFLVLFMAADGSEKTKMTKQENVFRSLGLSNFEATKDANGNGKHRGRFQYPSMCVDHPESPLPKCVFDFSWEEDKLGTYASFTGILAPNQFRAVAFSRIKPQVVPARKSGLNLQWQLKYYESMVLDRIILFAAITPNSTRTTVGHLAAGRIDAKGKVVEGEYNPFIIQEIVNNYEDGELTVKFHFTGNSNSTLRTETNEIPSEEEMGRGGGYANSWVFMITPGEVDVGNGTTRNVYTVPDEGLFYVYNSP